MQPGHSIGPRKLWNAGALTCYLLVSVTYNELLFKLHLFQDDGEPEAGQSVKGLSPFIAGLRLYGIQVSRPDRNRSYESGFV